MRSKSILSDINSQQAHGSLARRLGQVFVLIALVVGFGFIASITLKGHAVAAACAPTGTTYGTDTLTVSVPSDGTYNLWARMQAPDSADNSFMMQVDGTSCYNVGGSSSMALNTWTWVNYQGGSTSSTMQATLTKGTHTIELIGTDPGVSVDRIELLADPSCTPSGTGDNCAPSSVAPPTVSFTAPGSGATVNGKTVTVSASAASAPGVTQVGLSQVVFAIDGTTISTDTSSPYSTTLDTTTLSNGAHTLTATATDTQGQSTSTTEAITVNNVTACTGNPSTPTNLAGTSSSPLSVTLTWSAATPAAGCAIASYTIEQAGSVVGTSTGTSLILNTLVPNTIYSYTIKSADQSGHSSSYSAPALVTTQADKTAPSAPGSPIVQAPSPSVVQLNWAAATDNVGVAYYRIYRNGSTLYASTTGPSTTYTDNNAKPSTTYTYQISAVDTSGNEGPKASTAPVTITTPASTTSTPPTQPTNLKAPIISSNSIALQWTASTDSTGVSSYKVYRNNSLITTVTSGTSYTDSGLNPSTNYSYDVVAFDSSGNSSLASATLSITTLAGAVVACSPDLNGDGIVNFFDAATVYNHWGLTGGATCAEGDVNGDGNVNFFDAAAIYNHWGQAI